MFEQKVNKAFTASCRSDLADYTKDEFYSYFIISRFQQSDLVIWLTIETVIPKLRHTVAVVERG